MIVFMVKQANPTRRLFVVLQDPELSKESHERPFASIVALAVGNTPADDEVVAAKVRPCLHVFYASDATLEFADGVLAVKDKCVTVDKPIDWPELCAALSMPVKAYAEPLMPKKGEPPYLRVKNWAEDGFMSSRLEDETEGHALKALIALSRWNRWLQAAEEAKNAKSGKLVGWDDRLADIYSPAALASMSAQNRQSRGELLRKLCEKIGLKSSTRTDFDARFDELKRVLDLAHLLHTELRKKLEQRRR